MKLLNTQPKTLGIWLSRHWASTLAMLYPLLIFIDYYTLPLPEQIYQGQPFFYAWYMDNFRRDQTLILIGILLFFVLLVRSIFIVKFGASRFIPPIGFFIAAFLFVLWGVSTPATSGAEHLETTPVLNQAKYNMYRQFSFSNRQFQREAVLVKCDSIGLVCYFIQKWEWETPFLSPRPDPILSIDNSKKALLVRMNGKLLYTYPIE